MLTIVTLPFDTSSGSIGVSGCGLKLYTNGRWKPVNRIVPIPAILRSASGSKSIMVPSDVVPKMNRNQNIARKPKNWVMSPPNLVQSTDSSCGLNELEYVRFTKVTT